VAHADLVLHVVDASHPDPEGQIRAVREVLADVPGALAVPEVLVLNKSDIAEQDVLMRLRGRTEPTVEVSALTGAGLDDLLETVAQRLPRPSERVAVVLPYTRGDLVAEAHAKGEVLSEKHGNEGYELVALVSEALAGRMLDAEARATRD
ncbi:MAG: GTPase HflX, partial [Actinomycetota bacterium]